MSNLLLLPPVEIALGSRTDYFSSFAPQADFLWHNKNQGLDCLEMSCKWVSQVVIDGMKNRLCLAKPAKIKMLKIVFCVPIVVIQLFILVLRRGLALALEQARIVSVVRGAVGLFNRYPMQPFIPKVK